MITDPSGADSKAFICFSPTIEDFSNFKFSITNLGSGLPEPKGERELISEKKSSFNALGAIIESRYKLKRSLLGVEVSGLLKFMANRDQI